MPQAGPWMPQTGVWEPRNGLLDPEEGRRCTFRQGSTGMLRCPVGVSVSRQATLLQGHIAGVQRARCRQRGWSDNLRISAQVFGCETSHLLPAHIYGDHS